MRRRPTPMPGCRSQTRSLFQRRPVSAPTLRDPHAVHAGAQRQHRRARSAGSEIFDIGVQADVNILNRHLAGLPTFYGLSAQDVYTGPGGNGASDGDPNYTRERSFFLGISGLDRLQRPEHLRCYRQRERPTRSRTIATAVPPALPGASTPGAHDDQRRGEGCARQREDLSKTR